MPPLPFNCGTSHGVGDMVAAHFGLGEALQADLEIARPSGRVQRLTGVAADQWLVITEE